MVAVNGQPGETADATGIREYSAQPGAAVTQKPLFSLFPEGPQSGASGWARLVHIAAGHRPAHVEHLAGDRPDS